MSKPLASRIVEIRFQNDDGFNVGLLVAISSIGHGRGSVLADEKAEDIRLGEVLLAGAVADAVDSHCGKYAKIVRQRGDDCGSGGRRQLALAVKRGKRHVA